MTTNSGVAPSSARWMAAERSTSVSGPRIRLLREEITEQDDEPVGIRKRTALHASRDAPDWPRREPRLWFPPLLGVCFRVVAEIGEVVDPGVVIEVLTKCCGRLSLRTGGWSVRPDLSVVAAFAHPRRTVLVAPGWSLVTDVATTLAAHQALLEGGVAAGGAGASVPGSTSPSARARRRRRCSVRGWRFS